MEKNRAIDTNQAFRLGEDVSCRQEEILTDVAERSGFVTKEVIWISDYFGSGRVGAFHSRGIFENKEAILKIQGVEPEISEDKMIEKFTRQNESQIIRPPEIYKVLPWQDEHGYEALIIEYVEGEKVLASGQLQTAENIAGFFEIYQEYRQNCLRKPWLAQPEDHSYSLAKTKEVAKQVKPASPYRQPEDLDLVDKTEEMLRLVWSTEKPEFMHGHFSCEDLIRQGEGVVLFSNLFWRWDYPFSDAVFAYHWFMYSLARVEGIQPEKIDHQRDLWLEQIYSLPRVREDESNYRLLNAALLERAVAGLLVDAFAYIDKDNPVAEHMVSSTRQEIKRLLDELEN